MRTILLGLLVVGVLGCSPEDASWTAAWAEEDPGATTTTAPTTTTTEATVGALPTTSTSLDPAALTTTTTVPGPLEQCRAELQQTQGVLLQMRYRAVLVEKDLVECQLLHQRAGGLSVHGPAR